VTSSDRARPLHLTDVTIVDTVDGSSADHRDIRIEDGRISEITATGGPVASTARRVDGAGRFVIPGFVDMHAHTLDRTDPDPIARLMLTFGVTGYRQMSGHDALLNQRAAGMLSFPTDGAAPVSLSGPLLTPMNAGTAAAARAEIRRQKAEGADFLKIVGVTPDIFTAAQETADEVGLPIACHLPTGVDVRDASRLGIGTVEHLGAGVDIPVACSSEEAELRTRVRPRNVHLPAVKIPFLEQIMGHVLARIVINPSQSTTPDQLIVMQRAIDTFDEAKARALAGQFAADGTWHCPTLIRMKAQQLCDAPAFRDDPDLRFVTRRTREKWNSAGRKFEKFTSVQRATFAALYDLQKRLVGLFDKEGVSLLAGSDTVGAAWVVAGASLHDEFDELSAAGLSPLRVLQTATRDPARFLGASDGGRLAEGSRSDLVLLDRDPVADSRNLHGLAGVIRADHYASREDLDRTQRELAAVGVD
jgi:imidazolonepropionase-like amidohydrolase